MKSLATIMFFTIILLNSNVLGRNNSILRGMIKAIRYLPQILGLPRIDKRLATQVAVLILLGALAPHLLILLVAYFIGTRARR